MPLIATDNTSFLKSLFKLLKYGTNKANIDAN